MEYINTRNTFSRLASKEEIISTLYEIKFNNDNPRFAGIPIYADSQAVYVEHKDSHSLTLGSTGSKKTRLIGKPSLMLYAHAGESFIATDPKAELYERTLPLLKEKGYNVFVLNLRDFKLSNSWNPFLLPYYLYHNNQRDKAIELINDIANCISKESYSKEPYWHNSAADLLTGLILLLCECACENEINFKSLRALRTQAFKVNKNDVPFIKEYFLDNLNASSFICSLLNGTTEVCDSTRGCIVSTFDQALRPFFSQDKLIDVLSVNDIDMRKIGIEKTAVFLIIPDENTLYHSLISVFVKQCYTELIIEAQKYPNKTLPRRVNFLLDEFASLPTISDFPAMITASRSRNIRFNLIIQSFNQLYKRYGEEAETIKGNCENWVFLHSREKSVLEELVYLAGNKNFEEPLISASMLQTMSKDEGEALIFYKRNYPFITKLPDIDSYPDNTPPEKNIYYPVNNHKTETFFDFKNFCSEKNNYFFSQLFS